MTTAYADTNLFLRALVNDHEHHDRAVAVFEKVRAKKLQLVWTNVIFVEVIFAMQSKYYNVSRGEVASLLDPFFKLAGLKIEERQVAERALSIFASRSIDIADAWLIAKAQIGTVKGIYAFDRDYKNVEGVQWINPLM